MAVQKQVCKCKVLDCQQLVLEVYTVLAKVKVPAETIADQIL